MVNGFVVRRAERPPRLFDQFGGAFQGDAFRPDDRAQGVALDVLHHNEGLAAGELARIRDADDAGMIEAAEGLDLLVKFIDDPIIAVSLFEEDFDDDRLVMQLPVARQVDYAEDAAPELALDQITMIERLPDHLLSGGQHCRI